MGLAGKVLVVDDDASVQRLLQYTLKQEGYDVVIASDATDGLRLWQADSPTLILLDVTITPIDGYAVATKIRAEEGPGNHVPIIMLTTERDVQEKVRALRAGADDYLIKPFHPAELLARMKSLIARFAPSDSLVGRPPMGRIHAYYGAKGGVGHDDHRDQHGDRAPGPRPAGLPCRRQPPVRRPSRVPRPRARPQEHRRRGQRAVDGHRPHPQGRPDPRFGRRPAARAAVARSRPTS